MTIMTDNKFTISINEGLAFFKIDPKKSALLIIDMQEGFLAVGAPIELPAGREIIPNIERLLKVCRELKVPVVWTQTDHSPPYAGGVLKKFPDIHKVLGKNNTQYFPIYKDMPKQLENEFRVVKHKYDIFSGTDLDELLRTLKVETVIITGVATEVCCETAARNAFMRDYQVVFTSDGTASPFPDSHKATLKTLGMYFARVMEINDVIEELKKEA
jgi:ureidoacrylate peracid hydrolase